MDSNAVLKKRIKNAIISSGFPLEIYCKNQLFQKYWSVALTKYYLTKDGTYREIDCEASIRSEAKIGGNNTSFLTNMVIECKKSLNNPWVFFKHFSVHDLNIYIDDKYCDEYCRLKTLSQLKKHHFMTMKDVAESYMVPFGNQNENRAIYESVYKLIELFKSFEPHRKNPIRHHFIQVYYLTIVFDGSLFLADVNNDSKIDLKEKNHILLRVDQKSQAKYGHFAIDVVRKQYFEKYLDILRKDHTSVIDFFNKYDPKKWAETRKQWFYHKK